MENTSEKASSVRTLFLCSGADQGDVRCARCTNPERMLTADAFVGRRSRGDVRTDHKNRKKQLTGESLF